MSNVIFATELTKQNVLRAILEAYGRPGLPILPDGAGIDPQPADDWFAEGLVRHTIRPDVDGMDALPYESMQVLVGRLGEMRHDLSRIEAAVRAVYDASLTVAGGGALAPKTVGLVGESPFPMLIDLDP